MDAIETAVRNAFEKGDVLDPAFRERVYRAAFAATERSIESNRALTPEAAEKRRATVRDLIGQIESEFMTAAEPAPTGWEPSFEGHVPAAPTVEAETRAPAAAPYVEPRLEPTPAPSTREPDFAVDAAEADHRRAGRRRGGFLGRLLPVLLVLLLAAAGVWWALSSGFFATPEVVQVQAPDGAAAPGAGPGGGPLLPADDSAQDWVTVFSPDDPASVSAPAAASAEVMEDGGQRFVRVRSDADGAGVRFDVGEGILERIVGQRAVFNIVARAEEGMPTEIAVECDFGALGDCGRNRYQVNYELGDYLFEVELPDAEPDGAGSIAITSDVDSEGKAVNIFEIRVSIPE